MTSSCTRSNRGSVWLKWLKLFLIRPIIYWVIKWMSYLVFVLLFSWVAKVFFRQSRPFKGRSKWTVNANNSSNHLIQHFSSSDEHMTAGSLSAGLLFSLTIKFPVGDWCNCDATFKHGALREEEERGNKPSIGLERRSRLLNKLLSSGRLFFYYIHISIHYLSINSNSIVVNIR